MGAVVSLPITMAGNFFAACLGASCCSCCMNSQLNPLAHTFRSSVATRIMYAAIFCINSIFSWLSMSHQFISILNKISVGPFRSAGAYCREEGCTGFVNVQRIDLSLGILHLILAVVMMGVNSTSNPRAALQNGYWIAKLMSLAVISTISFMIPDKFFVVWGNYLSIFFGTFFLGIGLILLVDFAHEWAETCLEKIDEGEIYLEDDGDDDEGGGSFFQGSSFWRSLLVGGTLSMYLGTLIMTGIMFHYFSHNGCGMNTAFISVNVVLVLIVTGLSIAPVVQEYNSNAGLAQASMCCVYCTYLVFSACLSEPDDKLCNPLIRSSSTRTVATIVGALFTFVAIAYTTTRAAGNSTFNHGSDNVNYSGGNNYESVMDVITQEPGIHNEMRIEAIREAVNEGSLPESALTDPVFLEESRTDENNSTKYNYVLFHVIFFLATQYIAALLTINVVTDGEGFVPVGRTYFNTWLKVVSSWVCYLLYSWTLVAPVVFPERFS
ncbi:DEKNAAC105198 [Brettanomyces naardenensis]|uniref:DEKNAAC105198 n=1 Tax=Brettanomyces naardenensis TaxID=13370 RepID=A0A448YSV8_BRENA|nr:DEKNAAC105198 [Brettanomyces naardenensis]